MKIMQMTKRIFLLVAVNILVMTTITLVLGLLGAGRYFPQGRLAGLAMFCLVWGFGGAFISLALSRLMAKWMMGVKVIPPNTSDPHLQALVDTVHGLARSAGLPRLPEVGIYESDDVNAFATGPSKSRALVAVSTGLLQRMGSREVEGVLGHEVAHIANGDMVTMTLIQGIVNAFVMFASRVIAWAIVNGLKRDGEDSRGRGSPMVYFAVQFTLEIIFMFLGMMVVAWFSRHREYRADQGGAHVAGRGKMIRALARLRAEYESPYSEVASSRDEFAVQSLKISGKRSKFFALFSTHPALEDRIARLEAQPY